MCGACSEQEPDIDGRLLEISDRVVQRYENSKQQVNALSDLIVEQGDTKFKEAIALSQKDNLSAEELQALDVLLADLRESSQRDEEVIGEALRASAAVLALASTIADLCEDQELKSVFSSYISIIVESFDNTQMTNFYIDSVGRLRAELEHTLSFQECDDFKANTNNSMGRLVNAIQQFDGGTFANP